MDKHWSEVPRVLYITSNKPDATTQWRVWWPSSELVAYGYVADFIKFSDLDLVVPHLVTGRWNTIVTPRMAFGSKEVQNAWINMIKSFQDQHNIKWWYDVDDDILSESYIDRIRVARKEANTSSTNESDETYEDQRQSRLAILEHVDAITTGSKVLSDIVKTLSDKPTIFVPNGIHDEWFTQQVRLGKRQIQGLTVGWTGGERLEEELEPIYQVWSQLAAEFPDVKFVIQGWYPQRLLAALPVSQFRHIPAKAIEDYPGSLVNIDVSCCFASKPWQATKTPIKWIETSLAGAACVVSNILYGDIVTDGKDALVASTPDEWLSALRRLITDQALRQNIHNAALQTITAKHTIKQVYSNWLDAWASQLQGSLVFV